MIFYVRRATGFPLLLEPMEIQTLDYLENEGRFIELEDYERELRHSPAVKELAVECTKFEEILIFLNSLNHKGPITLDFSKKLIVIEDNGDLTQ